MEVEATEKMYRIVAVRDKDLHLKVNQILVVTYLIQGFHLSQIERVHKSQSGLVIQKTLNDHHLLVILSILSKVS